MSGFCKNANDKIKNYYNVLDVLSHSTDDFLFLLDIGKMENCFFGNVEKDYPFVHHDSRTNTIEEMLAITYEPDRKVVRANLDRIISGEADSFDFECRWVNRGGVPVWVSCRGMVIKEADVPEAMIGRVSEEAMRHLFNPLTGLFNKIKLTEDLKRDYETYNSGYIILVDIDDLAAINLAHGRKFGDVVIRRLAHLMESIPQTKQVYHVDHNYFAAILDAQNEEEVRTVYDLLQKEMEDVCTLTTGAVPLDSALFEDANSIYDSVKMILRKAKKKGNSTILFYSEEIIKHKIESRELLEELHESVLNDFEGFYLVYQPQFKTGNYSLYATEALLRYKSPVRGTVYPDEFIPILEDSRLINAVGMWVLETALMQCKQWRKKSPDLRMSVNFSVVQLSDETLAKKVADVLERVDVPGDALTVEITESVQLRTTASLYEIIKQLRNIGVHISIDDFGTGYANMSYLKELKVDEIKIDRVFVKDIKKDTYNYKLVRNMTEFAKTNSIRTCCEGVEEASELMVLEGLSPELLQGYLFCRPCSPEELELAYLDPDSKEHKKYIDLIEKLYISKERLGVIHFDPKDILRDTGVGLWIIRIDEKDDYHEMHADETLERIMNVNRKFTPGECYEFWHSRIKEDYLSYVHKNVAHMIETDNVVQFQYPWIHPELGEVTVRCTGIRTEDSDGMIVLEGYLKILSNIEEM